MPNVRVSTLVGREGRRSWGRSLMTIAEKAWALKVEATVLSRLTGGLTELAFHDYASWCGLASLDLTKAHCARISIRNIFENELEHFSKDKK